MLLSHARAAARAGEGGATIPLSEQNRARCDQMLIAEAHKLIETALSRGEIGPYQLQAAIQAIHAEALDHTSTDWAQIAALYALLEHIAPNPVVSLNRVVARSHPPARDR